MRLAPRPPRAAPQRGVLAGVGEALSFAVSSRRVAVTFFTVLLVSHVLVQLRRAAAARGQADARPGSRHVRADRLGVRRRCALRRDDPRDDRPDAPAARAHRRRRLRHLPARARAPGQPARRLRDPVRDRDLLHPLGLELARDAAALGARAPARQGGEPLLLRLHGRRPARRADRRHASPRRAAPGSPSPCAGTMAILVAATGAAVLYAGRPARGDTQATREVEA